MSAAPLFHVGYVKTGSTWLQRFVTNKRELGLTEVLERPVIRSLIVHPNELWYDAEAVRAAYEPRARAAGADGLTPVLTHERLSGNPISGGYDAAIIARRLHELAPDARIVLVIREQRAHLMSIYAEYVAGGGALPIDEFVEPLEGSQVPLFDRRFLEFDRLIAVYQSLFGRERVLVLPFELLRRDRLAFCNRILTFAGRGPAGSVPEDVVRQSVGSIGVGLRRRFNRVATRNRITPGGLLHVESLPRVVRALDRLFPASAQSAARARMQSRIAQLVGDGYARSNARTEELTGLDLDAFGYPVRRD